MRRAADRRHRDAAEEVRQEAPEDETDHDIGVGQIEGDIDALEEASRRRGASEEFEVLGIGGKEHKGAEAGRANGIALGDGLGGVAYRIERIGVVAHFLGQARHFGNAAGIVGDRAKSVERHHHARQRQHRGHRDRDAEEPGKVEGDDDAADDDEGGKSGRFKRDGKALYHIRAVPGDRGFGNRIHRPKAGAGIIFGDPDDEARYDEADQAAPEKPHRREAAEIDTHAAEHIVDHRIEGD